MFEKEWFDQDPSKKCSYERCPPAFDAQHQANLTCPSDEALAGARANTAYIRQLGPDRAWLSSAKASQSGPFSLDSGRGSLNHKTNIPLEPTFDRGQKRDHTMFLSLPQHPIKTQLFKIMLGL